MFLFGPITSTEGEEHSVIHGLPLVSQLGYYITEPRLAPRQWTVPKPKTETTNKEESNYFWDNLGLNNLRPLVLLPSFLKSFSGNPARKKQLVAKQY